MLYPPENPIVCHYARPINDTFVVGCCKDYDHCNRDLKPILHVKNATGNDTTPNTTKLVIKKKEEKMGEGRVELIGNRKFLLGGSGFTHVLDFPVSVLAGAFLFFPVILARYYVVQRLFFLVFLF